jgi:hypothetical protein
MTAFLAAYAGGRDWSSRSRTQGAKFAKGKRATEDGEPRRARRVIQVCAVGEAVIST